METYFDAGAMFLKFEIVKVFLTYNAACFEL